MRAARELHMVASETCDGALILSEDSSEEPIEKPADKKPRRVSRNSGEATLGGIGGTLSCTAHGICSASPLVMIRRYTKRAC